jgi:hypothetical protein
MVDGSISRNIKQEGSDARVVFNKNNLREALDGNE